MAPQRVYIGVCIREGPVTQVLVPADRRESIAKKHNPPTPPAHVFLQSRQKRGEIRTWRDNRVLVVRPMKRGAR